jgi:hypothetical protein
MRKAQKRSPPSAPESPEKDQAHLNWIRQNSTNLVRTAQKLYHKSGRGTFIIREQDAKPSSTTARYLTLTGAYASETGWPDFKTEELVRSYDPAQQFVIAFVYRDGTASAYMLRFVQTGDTFTIEST